jgi:hypothetical protein
MSPAIPLAKQINNNCISGLPEINPPSGLSHPQMPVIRMAAASKAKSRIDSLAC